jgi:hypothetical protein
MIEIPHTEKYWDRMLQPMRNDPCIVCGREITAKNPAMLWVVDGGGVAATREEAKDTDPAGDLGLHPIGSKCLKNHPELVPYVIQ